MNSRFSEIKLRINIDAPMPRVYEAWASAAGMESWFLKKCLITHSGQSDGRPLAQKDDQYEWAWHGYADATHKGRYLEANGVDKLSFSFAEECPVHVRLLTECGETIVELVESTTPISDEEAVIKRYQGDSKGWIFYLTNLKSILEGGIDLRNKKVELSNVITA